MPTDLGPQKKWPLWLGTILSFLACVYIVTSAVYIICEVPAAISFLIYMEILVFSTGILLHIVLFVAISRNFKEFSLAEFHKMVNHMLSYVVFEVLLMISGFININRGNFGAANFAVATIIMFIALLNLSVVRAWYNRSMSLNDRCRVLFYGSWVLNFD